MASHTTSLIPGEARRFALLAGGLLVGLALALASGGFSWEGGAVGLGFVLAVLAGLAQRCSA
ncbi:MAG: hypothetical protein WD939_05280 [Dehalococcoidia bacterium]